MNKNSKKMSRAAALLLSVLMLLSIASLSGCGQKKAESSAPAPSQTVSSQAGSSAASSKASDKASSKASGTSKKSEASKPSDEKTDLKPAPSSADAKGNVSTPVADSEKEPGKPASSQAGADTEGVEKSITLKVVYRDGKEKAFSIATKSGTLRKALEGEKLIQGDESEFGLFVKTVDGETADDSKQEWWCLTKGGAMWNYGVDDTKISEGDKFEFTLKTGY